MHAAKYSLTWDLDALYPHPEKPEFQALFERFAANLAKLAADSESLPQFSSSAASTWGEFFDRLADVFARSDDLHSFIGCHAAADAENKLFQQIEGQLSALGPLRQQVLTNVELALKTLSESGLESVAQADERLAKVVFFLDECRRNAALRLPKDQELLAADLAVNAIHAWGRLYDRLSGELRVTVMEKGDVVRKSPSQVTFDSPERTVRQNNFYAADKAWTEIADTCADSLNHISGFRLAKYRRLGLKDHLDAPLRNNRMRRETLEAMWSAVAQRRSVLLKYFAAKARLLGLEKLSWYDVLAPLPSPSASKTDAAAATLTYDAACDLVIKTFGEFSGELGDFAQRAIDERWIEVENRPGKRQGGFCTGLPTRKQSRIFMTFTNTADSMSTLAHELGHAYHSYVLRDEPLPLQDYPSNLAETASTFAEAVLGERRLADAGSADQQRAILDHMLSDAVAFCMNIHARFIFEDNFHRERRNGELSAERFSELMLAAQREAYCDGLHPDGWYPRFWISKLHFYITGNPFYNFPYTFGYLLSQGVYAHAKSAGPGFADQYRKLLIATGSELAEDAVKSTLGYDLTRPEFWNKSLDIIDERVAKFVELSE
jgi:oligoendopeptidase F